MRFLLTALLAALALPAVASAGTVFLLDGRGWGHGVGMSQWGAEGYARHGYGYKQILAHYYRGSSLAVVHPRPVRVLLVRNQHAISVGSSAPHGVTAINVLPLDRYLRGVVPWEVPKGWHEATYLVQAVAARSYTLATLKPGKDFDLYPDQRSQMYGGVRAERPETNLAIGA